MAVNDAIMIMISFGALIVALLTLVVAIVAVIIQQK
ncbi:putative holin-like toxin [Paenibacillus sp. HB172176]|nr:putative holin-like toxin [Paenibacillus sp. HB172176]